MPPFKIIFVHGYTASSEVNWYPTLRPKLDALGIEYAIPDLPGHKHPHSQDWIQIIHQEVNKSDKSVVLVGHSLGTRAILLYLDQFKTQVEAVLLVAPLSDEIKNADRKGGQAYPDFFEYQIDLTKVKAFSKRWLILHSTDDHSLPYHQHGLQLSQEMDVPLQTFQDREHFIQPDNAPFVFEALRGIVMNLI